MTSAVAAPPWDASQQALHEVVARLTAMLRELPESGVPAVGQWSASDVALHLSQVWEILPGLAARGGVEPGIDPGRPRSMLGSLSELADFTTSGVDSDPERDLHVLADRIDTRAAAYFAESEGRPPGEHCPWLVEGTFVSRSLLACHLLSENIIHGYDIARATRHPWSIERAHAGMILTGFLAAVIPSLEPGALVVQEKAGDLRATYDIRVRGGHRFAFVFEDGGLRVEDPAGRPVDCHLSADPVAMLLVAWGRKSQWPAIARGQLLAWGRKPWLALRLRSYVRNP